MENKKTSLPGLEVPSPKVQVPNGLPVNPSPHVRSQVSSPAAESPETFTSSTSFATSSSRSSSIKPRAVKRPKPLKLDGKSGGKSRRDSPRHERSSSMARLGQKLKDIKACFHTTPTPTTEARPVNKDDKIRSQKAKKKKAAKAEYDYEDIGDCHWADDY